MVFVAVISAQQFEDDPWASTGGLVVFVSGELTLPQYPFVLTPL
jgi:hypothetical protein